MICSRCQKSVATVHVTEVGEFVAPGHADNSVRHHSVCEGCAQELNLPHAGVPHQAMAKVWKLLNLKYTQKTPGPSCPSCGMTLEELRRRGRVGCEQDYVVFRKYLDELLERMHGAREHTGRLPGIPEGELERAQRVRDLRTALEVAIQEEDYERAATLRDEIQTLETGSGAES